VIAADLHGKLRSIEHHEDVLTSNVFSTLRLFPPFLLLRPFLATSAPEIAEMITPGHRARYTFWPRMAGRTEPDVLVEVSADGHPIPLLFLIEVKYLSGLSGSGIDDQEDLGPDDGPDDGEVPDAQAQEESRHQLARQARALTTYRADLAAARVVIYLTTHSCEPSNDIPAIAPVPIRWLSWNDLAGVVERVLPDVPDDDLRRPQLAELLALLRWKGFDRFHGFSQLSDRANALALETARSIFYADRPDGFAGFTKLAGLSARGPWPAGPVFFNAGAHS
jgi:hypothetical protein